MRFERFVFTSLQEEVANDTLDRLAHMLMGGLVATLSLICPAGVAHAQDPVKEGAGTTKFTAPDGKVTERPAGTGQATRHGGEPTPAGTKGVAVLTFCSSS